jgi:hypothetical protein
MSKTQVTGQRLAVKVGATPAPVGGVRGIFVPHMFMRTKASVESTVALAQAARLTVIYPNVLRYSRELFKGKFPRYTYKPDGSAPELEDEYAALLDCVKQNNADLPPELQIKVIPWVEMFLNRRTDKDEDKLEGGKYETAPTLQNVLDVDDPDTRELLVSQLVDLAAYYPEGEGIHIDDHLSYPPGKAPEGSENAYEAKMTRFARWLIPEFKRRAPGKVFEISTNGLKYATDHTQARWSEWGADRVLIQLYLPNANSIIGHSGDKKNKTYQYTHASGGANVTGIGVTCVANGAQVPDDDLIKVMKFEAKDGKSVIVWHSGELAKRQSLIQKIADLSRAPT